jgi:hypothetical protein
VLPSLAVEGSSGDKGIVTLGAIVRRSGSPLLSSAFQQNERMGVNLSERLPKPLINLEVTSLSSTVAC